MGNKNTGDINTGQSNYKNWRGDWPQIVDGTLQVEINDVLYFPKLISSTKLVSDGLEAEIDIVWLVFKMGKDIFMSKAYNLITKE